MDQFAYAKKLEKDMPLKWLFQQDNVPNQVLVPNKHLVMEWPAQSLNLNPIKNLWAENAVSEEKPRIVNELWNVVK